METFEGEPEKMTKAELEVLQSRDLLGEVRLSCQALCDHDVKVRVLMTVTSTGLDGPGPRPEPSITPDPVGVDKPTPTPVYLTLGMTSLANLSTAAGS